MIEVGLSLSLVSPLADPSTWGARSVAAAVVVRYRIKHCRSHCCSLYDVESMSPNDEAIRCVELAK